MTTTVWRTGERTESHSHLSLFLSLIPTRPLLKLLSKYAYIQYCGIRGIRARANAVPAPGVVEENVHERVCACARAPTTIHRYIRRRICRVRKPVAGCCARLTRTRDRQTSRLSSLTARSARAPPMVLSGWWRLSIGRDCA